MKNNISFVFIILLVYGVFKLAVYEHTAKVETAKPKVMQKPNLTFTQNKSSPTLQLILDQYTDSNEVLTEISKYEGLERKRLIAEYRQYLSLNFANKFKDEINKIKEEQPENQLTLVKVFELAQQGLWDEAIDLMSSLNIENKVAMSNLLIVALATKPKFEIYQYLLERGAILPKNTVYMLMLIDNAGLAEKLLPYGLNLLQYVDPRGYTGLMLAVEHNAGSMFNLLIQKGADINGNGNGNGNGNEFDALDIALAKFGINSSDTYFIKALLFNGAEIKLSHKQRVEEIKQTNIGLYLLLLQITPEFRGQFI